MTVMMWLPLWVVCGLAQSQGDTDGYALGFVTSGWGYIPSLSDWYSNRTNQQGACSWVGIQCDIGKGRVTEITLGSYGIKGTLNNYILQLSFLQALDLSFNNFSGPIPEFGSPFGGGVSTPEINSLDLRNNQFNGPIPLSLQNLSYLNNLNLSYNNLSGTLPPGLQKFDCSSFIGNQLLTVTNCSKVSLSPSAATPTSGSSSSSIAIIIPIIVLVAVAAVALFLFLRYRAKLKKQHHPGFQLSELQGVIAPVQFRKYSYREVSRSTSSFSASKIIGEGGASTVFRAKIDNIEVAIKRLNIDPSRDTIAGFERELQLLSRPIHRNILPILGYCADDGCPPCIIMPFMKHGSVRASLSGENRAQPPQSTPFDWPVRKKIIISVAQGLAYLHEELNPPIIHRDIKAANVLLDENFNAVITDFGLARSFQGSEESQATSLVGTPAFMAPEYARRGLVSTKMDVFAFGVFILELVSGSNAEVLVRSQHKEELQMQLREWVTYLTENDLQELHLIDQRLQDSGSLLEAEDIKGCIKLALACMSADLSERPSMSRCLSNFLDPQSSTASRHSARFPFRADDASTILSQTSMDGESQNFDRSGSVSSLSHVVTSFEGSSEFQKTTSSFENLKATTLR